MTENGLVRGPKWRTRTSPERRRLAVGATAVAVVAVGLALMVAAMWLLELIGAPTWIVIQPWLAPTVGLGIWALASGDPALLTNDDDDTWVGYSIRRVLAGEGERRPAPVRVIVALLLGAPICWAYLLFGLLALVVGG